MALLGDVAEQAKSVTEKVRDRLRNAMVQSLMRTFGEDLKALRARGASEAEFFRAVTMALESPVYVYNLMDLAEIKDFAQVIRAAKSLMRAGDEYYDKFGNRQTVVVGGTGEDRDEWNWVQSDVEMLDMLLRERMRPEAMKEVVNRVYSLRGGSWGWGALTSLAGKASNLVGATVGTASNLVGATVGTASNLVGKAVSLAVGDERKERMKRVVQLQVSRVVQAKLSKVDISEDKLRGHPLAFHTKEVTGVWANDRYLVTVSKDKSALGFNIRDLRTYRWAYMLDSEATCVCGIDGKNAVVGTQRGWVYLLSLDDGVLQKKFQVDKKVHKKVAGVAATKNLLYVGCGNKVFIYNKNHALEKEIELFTHILPPSPTSLQFKQAKAKDILQLSSNTDGLVLVVTPTALFQIEQQEVVQTDYYKDENILSAGLCTQT